MPPPERSWRCPPPCRPLRPPGRPPGGPGARRPQQGRRRSRRAGRRPPGSARRARQRRPAARRGGSRRAARTRPRPRPRRGARRAPGAAPARGRAQPRRRPRRLVAARHVGARTSPEDFDGLPQQDPEWCMQARRAVATCWHSAAHMPPRAAQPPCSCRSAHRSPACKRCGCMPRACHGGRSMRCSGWAGRPGRRARTPGTGPRGCRACPSAPPCAAAAGSELQVRRRVEPAQQRGMAGCAHQRTSLLSMPCAADTVSASRPTCSMVRQVRSAPCYHRGNVEMQRALQRTMPKATVATCGHRCHTHGLLRSHSKTSSNYMLITHCGLRASASCLSASWQAAQARRRSEPGRTTTLVSPCDQARCVRRRCAASCPAW